MRMLSLLSWTVSLLMLALVATPATAAEFTDAQKTEMGTVIKDYLLKNPEILQQAMAELQRKQAEQQASQASDSIKQNADAIYRASADQAEGNLKGKVTVVEFFDYNCPYCKRMLPAMAALLESDKDVRIVMKEFPILGEGSVYASRAAVAAVQQGKYWPFHLALLGAQGRVDQARVLTIAKGLGIDTDKLTKDMQSPAITTMIETNNALAGKLGINGTPAFVIGDKLYPGAIEADQLKTVVAEARAKGCAIC